MAQYIPSDAFLAAITGPRDRRFEEEEELSLE